ncbi:MULTISPECIES: glycoside hydrolase family 32 protein [Atopobiaceae]|uniref:beta-fructofuranosidase n=1 Tax=Parafannyhessea umbonata TaxID=604330 RepID=A0A1H6I8A1_9ACTN|nr:MULTISPECIES: glycoside hydrolase family 32 protein [Atopobiaceae]SEH42984.1 beta-fructofuranosidase [Parafannyhessea umbonata]SJZ57325.1 beta-fructofuranosidase [Olsenella sp. KH1P3]
MTDKTWRMGFHLMPPSGWINDPNGLCQFRGVYHAFFQYSPDWPNGGERCWGHATSTNLVSWDYHDVAIHQDTPEDANGAYSGSTFVERGAAADGGDRMRIYYTGNVKHPGDYDYINEGRGANEITVTSDDGMHFSPKQVLLRNADYPAYCSCHVRDPKLWEQRGELHMALGARDRDSHGLALIYSSTDGIDWRLRTAIRPTDDFGFMWECPDVIRLVEGADGQRHEFLGFCPQGMPAKDDDGRGTSWAGYLPLSGTAIDATTADPALWREWDGGFDFYAPQTFVDDAGRTLLIAWVGMPDEDFMGQPEQLDWIHSLSVPRTLEVDPKDPTRIMQWPVGEVDALRQEATEAQDGQLSLPCHRADIEVEGVQGDFALTLDGALAISGSGDSVTLSLDAATGCGRGARSIACGGIESLRVLVDESIVEVFVNGGRATFTTRWFPTADKLDVRLEGSCASARAWTMAKAGTDPYEG